jgi:hypothetical protein
MGSLRAKNASEKFSRLGTFNGCLFLPGGLWFVNDVSVLWLMVLLIGLWLLFLVDG